MTADSATIARVVPCTACGAGVGERCRTPLGVGSHPARLARYQFELYYPQLVGDQDW